MALVGGNVKRSPVIQSFRIGLRRERTKEQALASIDIVRFCAFP